MVTIFGNAMMLVHDNGQHPQLTVHVVLSRADFDQVPGDERRIGENFIWLKRMNEWVEVATGEPPQEAGRRAQDTGGNNGKAIAE